jgi:hypothetical protein
MLCGCCVKMCCSSACVWTCVVAAAQVSCSVGTLFEGDAVAAPVEECS